MIACWLRKKKEKTQGQWKWLMGCSLARPMRWDEEKIAEGQRSHRSTERRKAALGGTAHPTKVRKVRMMTSTPAKNNMGELTRKVAASGGEGDGQANVLKNTEWSIETQKQKKTPAFFENAEESKGWRNFTRQDINVFWRKVEQTRGRRSSRSVRSKRRKRKSEKR